MALKSLTKFLALLSNTALLIIAGSAIILGKPEEASAEPLCRSTMSIYDIANDPSGPNCITSPTFYEIQVYQIGLCTANPLAGASLNTSSCNLVVNTETPQTATLIQDGVIQAVNLNKGNGISNVSPGTYPYAFALIAPVIKTALRFTFYSNTDTNHTTQALYRSVSRSVSNSSDDENYFFGDKMLSGQTSENIRTEPVTLLGNNGVWGCDGTNIAVPGGVAQARLLSSSLQPLTTQTHYNPFESTNENWCPSAGRLAAVVALTSPVVITNKLSSLSVQFKTTDYGSFVYSDGTNLWTGFGSFGVNFTANE
jgi:hypothetical protein